MKGIKVLEGPVKGTPNTEVALRSAKYVNLQGRRQTVSEL